MIYLILKIFLYLFVSLLLGFGAGWLTRNVVSVRREDELQRSITDARARVPQFESLMRTRDEQLQRLRDEHGGKDQRINELSEQIQRKEEAIREKDRELRKVAAHGVLDADGVESSALVGGEVLEFDAAPARASSDTTVVQLKTDLLRLEQELRDARTEAADAMAEAASAETALAQLRSESRGATGGQGNPASEASANEAMAKEVAELQARLRQKAEEQERLNKVLETEQRKVVELERERELQNKSLQVLHQQLELERERSDQSAAG